MAEVWTTEVIPGHENTQDLFIFKIPGALNGPSGWPVPMNTINVLKA